MSDKKEANGKELLCRAFLSLDDTTECSKFLDDLLTPKEIEEISNRLRCAKMLSGKKVYNEIIEETGLSTATISRINKCLKKEYGGYNIIMNRIKDGKDR